MQVLADLDLAKMEFFQNVSHELRTPLTLLLAPLQDLLDQVEPGPVAVRRREDRETCRPRCGPRTGCALMVDALLDFSGAEAARLAPDRQPSRPGRADRRRRQHVPVHRRARRPAVRRRRARPNR